MNKKEASLKIYHPTEKFYQTHITFSSVADIKTLTEPLLTLGISYFTFDRTYKDGSHIRLTNAGKWIESYYRQKLYDVAIFEKDPNLFTDGYVFWNWLKREPVYAAAAEHNIDHGLTITQPHEKYCDFYHFGTTRDNPVPPEFLIKNMPMLYRFIAFFKQSGKKLIAQAENTRFILPITALHHVSLQDINQPEKLPDIIQKSEITRLYLGDEFDNAYLTRKEMEILSLLSQGQTPATIAQNCQLSYRTLETHIKNIKAKFKCETLFELGYLTAKLGIHKLYPFEPTGE